MKPYPNHNPDHNPDPDERRDTAFNKMHLAGAAILESVIHANTDRDWKASGETATAVAAYLMATVGGMVREPLGDDGDPPPVDAVKDLLVGTETMYGIIKVLISAGSSTAHGSRVNRHLSAVLRGICRSVTSETNESNPSAVFMASNGCITILTGGMATFAEHTRMLRESFDRAVLAGSVDGLEAGITESPRRTHPENTEG